MNTHPSLARSADNEGFSDEYGSEGVNRASYASGYPLQVKLFTWMPRTFGPIYKNVQTMYKLLAQQFYEDNSDVSFYWLNPQDSTIYEVVFTGPPRMATQSGSKNKNLWQISYSLRQATPMELPVSEGGNPFYGGFGMIAVENLASGADIINRPIFSPDQNITITRLKLLFQGVASGITDTYPAVITIKNNDGDIIATKTYDTANQPPTNDVDDLTAVLDSDYVDVDTSDFITLTVSQGASANLPAFMIGIGGIYSA
jgi:hypothetical protein